MSLFTRFWWYLRKLWPVTSWTICPSWCLDVLISFFDNELLVAGNHCLVCLHSELWVHLWSQSCLVASSILDKAILYGGGIFSSTIFLVPDFASWSAISFPVNPKWALIHLISTEVLSPSLFSSRMQFLTTLELICTFAKACKAAWLSVKMHSLMVY